MSEILTLRIETNKISVEKNIAIFSNSITIASWLCLTLSGGTGRKCRHRRRSSWTSTKYGEEFMKWLLKLAEADKKDELSKSLYHLKKASYKGSSLDYVSICQTTESPLNRECWHSRTKLLRDFRIYVHLYTYIWGWEGTVEYIGCKPKTKIWFRWSSKQKPLFNH